MSLVSYLWGWTNLGIKRGDLVLEVGSGAHPLARSDVLCDMFVEDSAERAFGQSIVVDRPFVCASAEWLPFRDASFDFLFSNHVLEHLIYPEKFLDEAMRVSRGGCIITPSEFCERIMYQQKHLWMVTVDQAGVLTLQQKHRANEADVPGLLHEVWLRDKQFRRFFDSRPDLFEVRFGWQHEFTYNISRLEVEPTWLLKSQIVSGADAATIRGSTISAGPAIERPANSPAARRIRALLSRAVRRFHSKRRIDLYALLACPICHKSLQMVAEQRLECIGCSRVYDVRPDGIPVLLPDGEVGLTV